MVDGSRQDLAGFTAEVKGESLSKFETLDHHKAAVSKLSTHDGMLGELISCLDKAAQDATLTKEDAAAAKTKKCAGGCASICGRSHRGFRRERTWTVSAGHVTAEVRRHIYEKRVGNNLLAMREYRPFYWATTYLRAGLQG